MNEAERAAGAPPARQRLRVAMLTTSFPLHPASVSGVFVQRLVEYTAAHAEVTVVTPCAREAVSADAGQAYRIRCFRYAPRRWQVLAHAPGGLPAALKGRRLALLLLPGLLLAMLISCIRIGRQVDVIHANWSVNGVIAGLAALLTRTPVVTTLRGGDVTRAERHVVDRLLLKLCARLSARLVTVSAGIAAGIRAALPHAAARISVIPNGVDAAFVELPPRARAETEPLQLVTIGNLIASKGVDTLIQALRLRVSTCPGVLTVIGDGPQRAELERLATALPDNSKVVFAGQRPHADIVRYLGQSDAFVFGSYSEGRPNAVIEAMAAGLPVLAADIDAVRELVQPGATGVLFEPGDAHQLATAIDALIEQPQLAARYGRAARQFILDAGLTWQAAARRYDGVYRQVVAEHQAKGSV